MKFTLFVVVIAAVLFAGYFGINYAIEKMTYEPVIMEAPLTSTGMYPTALMFLADNQRDSYSVKNFAILIDSDSVTQLSNLQTSLLILNPDSFTKKDLQQIKSNKRYVVAELNLNSKDIYEKVKEYLDFGYNGFYFVGLKQNKELINLVEDLSNKIKARNVNALVLTNAENLRDNEFINYIDGVVAENIFYENNIKQLKIVLLDDLRYLTSKGKLVLSVDYSEGLNNRCNFVNNSKANKFIPFVASEDLDSIPNFNCEEIKYSQ